MSDVSSPPPLPDAIPGTTQSAGQSVDEGRGRIFPCEGCGADLKFDIGVQSLKCPYCGFEKQIALSDGETVCEQDFHAILERLSDLKQAEDAHQSDGQSEVRCDACGGTVLFYGSLTSSECPYCASPIQRDKIHDAADRIPVDGVLPFTIPKDRARQNLTAWVKSRWFAPNDFLQRGVDGKFSGVYLPYWTFDSLTFTHYSGQRGEYYWETVGSGDKQRRVRRTRWYPAGGRFQRFFDDVLVLAAGNLRHDLIQSLEPWPLNNCIPFNQEVLAGHLARTYETQLEDGFRAAQQRIDAALQADVRSRIGGDTQRVHSVNTRYDAITFKHLLLPVWLLAYRYHGEAYQVMINAATGEVQGERPYSWLKIALAVLCGLVIAGVIAFLTSQ